MSAPERVGERGVCFQMQARVLQGANVFDQSEFMELFRQWRSRSRLTRTGQLVSQLLERMIFETKNGSLWRRLRAIFSQSLGQLPTCRLSMSAIKCKPDSFCSL